MNKSLSVIGDLIKYKLSLAVVLSAVTGYFLSGANVNIHFFYLLAGVFFLASGAAVLNQYTERLLDSQMGRTRNRPIPSKKISEKRAVIISGILFLAGSIFLILNGVLTFFLGILTVVLYNLIYTHLKKKTILSIIPGALVGALPPMIGFSAGGGTLLDQYNIAFSMFIFLWQLPHFWLIVLKYGKEYNDAGFITISKYLNDLQIRYLIFFWILFSSGILFFFFIFSESISTYLFYLFLFLNLSFIILFQRLLFRKQSFLQTSAPFILINSFSLIIMVVVIIASLYSRF